MADLDDADIVQLVASASGSCASISPRGVGIARRAAVQQVHLENLIHVPGCTPAAPPGNLRPRLERGRGRPIAGL
jgi:hypothetical protein